MTSSKGIEAGQITAVILAGGKGRRLQGYDKGLVEFRGKPMIEHILEILAPQLEHICINANRNHDQYASYGVPVINDQLSNFQGPLAGFAAAMQHATTDYILTLPCDGPFLSSDFVLRMATTLAESDAELAVAHDGERLQPVHALIPLELAASLHRFLESGERKIDRWYEQHFYLTVDFSDQPQLFANINTQHQLDQYQEDI